MITRGRSWRSLAAAPLRRAATALALAALATGLLMAGSGTAMAATTTISTTQLQWDLAGLSYLPLSGIDGDYGPQTTAAVKAFQTDQCLSVDGVAGPQTDGALSSVVTLVQEAVVTTADGMYGPNTEAAVKIFQRTFNLLQDGKVGRSTWNRINQIWVAVTKLSELNGEGERIGLDPNPPTVVIRQGSRGADVIHAQFILNYVAQFYPDIPAPLMDSVFGASTTEAVRAFQSDNGLKPDGITGEQTRTLLHEKAKALNK